VFSAMLSGFIMRYLVEEPVQIRQDLNFDYTKNSPVAFVSIKPCGGVACDDEDCKENIGNVKSLKRIFVSMMLYAFPVLFEICFLTDTAI